MPLEKASDHFITEQKNSNKRASGRKLGNSSEWRKQFSLEGTKKYTKGRGCAGKRADPGTEVRI